MVHRAVFAGPFHIAKCHEADASRESRVGFHPVEPRARTVLVAWGGGGGPDKEREAQRHEDEERDARPGLYAPQLVEGHEGEEHEKPYRPVDRFPCLIKNAHDGPLPIGCASIVGSRRWECLDR